jgi:hypothetical protein
VLQAVVHGGAVCRARAGSVGSAGTVASPPARPPTPEDAGATLPLRWILALSTAASARSASRS